uniref:Solute carrier family 23 member 2 n=1 Tax=Plectus sambesii TaxID=2011161 RepID=A0A914X599_9BILA
MDTFAIGTGTLEKKPLPKEEKRAQLYYRAGDYPTPLKALLFGVQQLIVCSSGLLVTPYILSTIACAGTATATIRVKLIATTLVVSGIATLLQNVLGVRLALLQGPSFAYFAPIYAFEQLPEFKCNATPTDDVPEEDYLIRLRLLQGGLIGSSIIQTLIGLTGLIGLLTRFIGPLTIAPLMLLLSLSNMKMCMEYSEKHWVSLM